MSNRKKSMADREDAWIGIYWRPAAAIVYLMICIFDFIIVPTYLGIWAPSVTDIILAVKDLPVETQTLVLGLKLTTWEPLTLKGGGLFHVAFGAILGATVWSRGQERINEIKQGWTPDQVQQSYDNYQGYQPNPVYQPPGYQGYPGNPVNSPVQQVRNGGQVDNPEGE